MPFSIHPETFLPPLTARPWSLASSHATASTFPPLHRATPTSYATSLLLPAPRHPSASHTTCPAPPCSASAAMLPVPGDAVAASQVLSIKMKTLKKILPPGLMFLCIFFNYTILRDTKDVLIITVKGSSVEIISFLKMWVNLPMAIGFMLLYTMLTEVLSKEALFYVVIFPFISFFGDFAYVLYPMRDAPLSQSHHVRPATKIRSSQAGLEISRALGEIIYGGPSTSLYINLFVYICSLIQIYYCTYSKQIYEYKLLL
jgi:hypothetical protein